MTDDKSESDGLRKFTETTVSISAIDVAPGIRCAKLITTDKIVGSTVGFGRTNGGDMLKRCLDCGCFVPKDSWVKKGSPNNEHPLCNTCWNKYDDPIFL